MILEASLNCPMTHGLSTTEFSRPRTEVQQSNMYITMNRPQLNELNGFRRNLFTCDGFIYFGQKNDIKQIIS